MAAEIRTGRWRMRNGKTARVVRVVRQIGTDGETGKPVKLDVAEGFDETGHEVGWDCTSGFHIYGAWLPIGSSSYDLIELLSTE